jgi:hypothetical protein
MLNESLSIRNLIFATYSKYLFLISAIIYSSCSIADTPSPDPALAALQKQVELLKQENELQKQSIESNTSVINSQKGLFEAQKGLIDSQTSLLGSQKSMLDSLFPKIEGGKKGSLSFETTTKIGPLAQPNAVSLINNSISKEICNKTINSLTKNGSSGYRLVVVSQDNLKNLGLAQITQLTLNSLNSSYILLLPTAPTVQTNSGLEAGLIIYGVGTALKQIASFTELFRSDVTVYSADVVIDEQMIVSSVQGCLSDAVEADTLSIPSAVYSKVGLINAKFNHLSDSTFYQSLIQLSKFRIQAVQEINRIANIRGTIDPKDAEKKAKLEGLNSQYDSVMSSLFTISEQQKEPSYLSVLLGEAVLKKLTDDIPTYLLAVRLIQNAASAAKVSNIWTSDKLVTWSSATVDYSVTDQSGKVLSAGTVGETGTKNMVNLK